MAVWEDENPGQSTSICNSVEGLLHRNTLQNTLQDLLRDPANHTLGMLRAEAECDATIKEAVFINNLYLGVAALLAPVLSVYMVVPLGKRNLLSK